MPEPTFILAGAPKSGTTSLFRYLAQHPDIAVAAVKEPCFFAPEVPVDAETDAHRRSWQRYLALFEHAGSARAIGAGLYGVDVKQTARGVAVIEVNDNPNLEHGVEDLVAKEELWARLLQWFVKRIDA